MSISCDHRAEDDIPGFEHTLALAAGKGCRSYDRRHDDASHADRIAG